MSAGLRRSSRVAAMTAPAAAAAYATPAKQKFKDDGYKLSTELTKASKDLIASIEEDYRRYPINTEDWTVFFCDYIDYIQKNIDTCLSVIPGLQHLTADDLGKVDLSGGGFDSEFDDFSKFNYNVGLYEALFTQFRDGTNKINNSKNLNEILSYVGGAVIRMANHYNKTSATALIEFYRKLACVLELAVYPEIFLQFMTGDSTGNTNRVDLKYHGEAKRDFYIGIWIRKQEFLGIITSNGKTKWKGYDAGLRLFVRNFIRRLITYMRTYNATYPLGYELPYNYNVNPKKAARNPLPFDGVYQYSTPPDNYYISREDWDFIPNIFLPDNCPWNSADKDYKDPKNWHHPPPQWWVDRTIEFFDNTEWWHVKDSVVESISSQVRGTVEHKKWMALNCILPQQYESYSETWDVEYEDLYTAHGGIISKLRALRTLRTKKNVLKDKRTSRQFIIIQDKDRAIHPNICSELKLKLKEYFKLNMVVVKSSMDGYQSHLRDGTYIDTLNNYSMLYNAANAVKAAKAARSKIKLRANTV